MTNRLNYPIPEILAPLYVPSGNFIPVKIPIEFVPFDKVDEYLTKHPEVYTGDSKIIFAEE